MRLLVVLAALFLPSVTFAQTPAKPAAEGKVHCSIQAPPAPGEALTALVSGNIKSAETLYAAQVASAPSPAAYAGLARSQLAANELPQALSTAKSALAATPTSAQVQALTGDVLLRSGLIRKRPRPRPAPSRLTTVPRAAT